MNKEELSSMVIDHNFDIVGDTEGNFKEISRKEKHYDQTKQIN